MEGHSPTPEHTYGFRDPSLRANWTRGFLFASIALGLGWIWVDWSAYQALARGDTAAEWPLWLMPISVSVALGAPVLVLTWIHRANHNVRALGASGLEFTPGWAVGWYFVPIAFFWKPLQAMLEIWRASVNPAYWRRQAGSALVGWWWALGIFTLFVADAVALVAQRLDMVSNPEAFEAAVDVVSGVVDIPLALILITIITRVHRMQMTHYRRQRSAGTLPQADSLSGQVVDSGRPAPGA